MNLGFPITFLHPWLALLAGGIAIPLLLALYFLKLRRAALRIPSTLLWRQAYEDLQVNTPFQRLRWSLLLLIQLLLLLLIVAAIGQPVMEGTGATADRIILIIDRSASMNAIIDEQTTRLDLAKERARKLIDRLGRGGANGAKEMMILAMGTTPEIISGFATNQTALLEALDSIEPTDEEADFARTLDIAGAFAAGRRGTGETATTTTDIVLISDGGVGDDPGADFSLRAGTFRYLRIPDEESTESSSARNFGITDFSARRDYEDPTRVLIFLRLVGTASEDSPIVITILQDGEPIATRRLLIPPATTDSPGEITTTISLDLPGGGVIIARHNLEDDLLADNTAALIMPPPKKLTLALVHDEQEPDPFLRDLLTSLDPARVSVITTTTYPLPDDTSSGPIDFYVFDRVTPALLPSVPSLSFGGQSPDSGGENSRGGDSGGGDSGGGDSGGGDSGGGSRVLSWDRLHPLLRHVSLDTLVYADAAYLNLEQAGESHTLASGPAGPVIAMLESPTARHVLVGFPLQQSNWPTQVGLVIFLQNTLEFLTLADSGQTGLVFRPGETIRVQAELENINIPGVGTVQASGLSPVSLPLLRRAGVYAVEGAAAPMNRVAVSVLSVQESDLRPQDFIRVNAENASSSLVADLSTRELWPMVIALALILAIVEWLLYCVRIKGY